MEIKIDTDDLMGNECSVREEIISLVVGSFKEDLHKEIYRQVDKIIKAELKEQIQEQMKAQVALIVLKSLDHEYEEVTSYGEVKGKFTLRNKIADIFKNQCVFKTGGYSSDKNVFTKVIESVIESEVKKMKTNFTKLIDGEFLRQCHDYAITKIKERLEL